MGLIRNKSIPTIKEELNRICYDLQDDYITYKEAMYKARPYIAVLNREIKRNADRYNYKYTPFTFKDLLK